MTATAKLNLKLVPEDYTPPPNPSGEDKAKAIYAEGIREGRRRERKEQEAEASHVAASHVAHVKGLKEAHETEFARNAKTISRGAHRDGVLQGVALGMAAAIGLSIVTWYVMKDVVVFNTATQRVNYPAPPVITEPIAPQAYERGRREPASAP